MQGVTTSNLSFGRATDVALLSCVPGAEPFCDLAANLSLFTTSIGTGFELKVEQYLG